jgi:hypothetical protein
MKTPEGKVKDQIKAYLKEIGAYFFMPVQTGYGERTVDFLVCHKGKFYGIEAKRKRAQAEAFQDALIRRIEDAGGQAFVASSLETVKEWIKP